MTILVTGATGYIGREFIKSAQTKYNIIALVRKESDINKLEKFNCKIIRFDSYNEINTIFVNNNITGVIHFASNILIKHDTKDISSLINSNITFGTQLLEASSKTKVKWFINTGTFWQNYENKEYNPVNLYAATKEAFVNIAKFYTQTSDLVFSTIKLNDTFGPEDTRNKIFNLWYLILQNNEILDMSAGDQIIDISYIDDIISAYIIMIENLSKNDINKYNNKTFVVTNKEKPTLKELAKMFEDTINCKLNINWGIREYRYREVMIPYSSGISVPNWEQKFNIKEAIQKAIKDIRND
jgi:CDP-paratose synthetase